MLDARATLAFPPNKPLVLTVRRASPRSARRPAAHPQVVRQPGSVLHEPRPPTLMAPEPIWACARRLT